MIQQIETGKLPVACNKVLFHTSVTQILYCSGVLQILVQSQIASADPYCS